MTLNFNLHFRKFELANGTAFSRIYENDENLARYTNISEKRK